MHMPEMLISFGAGLVVGWNLLPQPVWVKGMYDKVATFVKGFFTKPQQPQQ